MDHRTRTIMDFMQVQETMIREKEQKRPEMMDRPVPIYEHECSEYPDQLRVSFMDGTTKVYDVRAEQPAPVIIENIKIIRKWKQGYLNQPARRRRRR